MYHARHAHTQAFSSRLPQRIPGISSIKQSEAERPSKDTARVGHTFQITARVTIYTIS